MCCLQRGDRKYPPMLKFIVLAWRTCRHEGDTVSPAAGSGSVQVAVAALRDHAGIRRTSWISVYVPEVVEYGVRLSVGWQR